MHAQQIAGGVHRLRTLMVNVYFIRDRASGAWALVDAGIRGYTGSIRRTAHQLFGTRPSAIFLTHGHFDHVGALPQLAYEWRVPVYAHTLEMPYVTGASRYPPPDPTVGGGAQSWMSPLFSRGPIDLGPHAHQLPDDGRVPGFPEWQWLFTGGHSPGHVSFFREDDRTLIAGDAVVTTKQESLINALLQQPTKVWRPPAYYTPDWGNARRSVEMLASLQPEVLATGHGRPMRGPRMRRELTNLAIQFDRMMPSSGRYIPYPAVTDERGLVHVPPRPRPAMTPGMVAAGVGVALGVGLIAVSTRGADNA